MSKQIGKGDLVMVVRPNPCCGRGKTLGKVFVVQEIRTVELKCNGCGRRHPQTVAVYKPYRGLPLPQLKKIDPPATGESLPTRTPIKEVA
jgi:hypothetical protein